MTRKATAAPRMERAPFEPCLTPGSFGNVLLAGVPRLVTELHRPRARTLRTWRAHFPFSETVQSLRIRQHVKQRAFGADDDTSHNPAPTPLLPLRPLPTRFLAGQD